jgi:hypothetical protein
MRLFLYAIDRTNTEIGVVMRSDISVSLSIAEASRLEEQLQDALNELRFHIERAEEVEDAKLNRGWGED